MHYTVHRKLFGALLAGSVLWLGAAISAMAQRAEPLLLLGTNPGTGIGVYNGVGVTSGFDLRYQHPVGQNLVLIGKTGFEIFRVKGRYAQSYQQEYQTTAGVSIPLTVGPRYYFLDRMYGGLNLGLDIGLSRLAATAFRFEPGVGIMVPLKAGGYLDLGSSVSTSFSRGSGAFLFTIAYGLPWSHFQ